MPALLKVKNHASISQQKVFWNNQTFPNLSRNVKLIMAIVTVVAGTKYKELVPGWILLAPVTEAEVVETIASLLRCPSWARDSSSHNDLSAMLDALTPATEVEPFPPCSASLQYYFPLLLLPSLFIGGLAVLELRRI